MYRLLVIMMLLCAFGYGVGAQPYSYIYIQGDKDMPFYVKLEGVMQPRYGKNHCILSELDPGTYHIEILFEQRKLPPQKFTIHVPANGYRGFLLNKKDNVYRLYDLRQRAYINDNDNGLLKQ